MSNYVLKRAEEVASLLSILGNAKRLIIVSLLAQGEMSVSAIAAQVDLSQSALSQHLAKLREQELMKTRRDKQTIYYSLESDLARDLLGALEGLYVAHAHPNAAREAARVA